MWGLLGVQGGDVVCSGEGACSYVMTLQGQTVHNMCRCVSVVQGKEVSKSLDVRGGRETKLDREERIQWSK
jgi:hypothetical protein